MSSRSGNEWLGWFARLLQTLGCTPETIGRVLGDIDRRAASGQDWLHTVIHGKEVQQWIDSSDTTNAQRRVLYNFVQRLKVDPFGDS